MHTWFLFPAHAYTTMLLLQIDDQFRQILSGIAGDPMVVHFADMPRITVSIVAGSLSKQTQQK